MINVGTKLNIFADNPVADGLVEKFKSIAGASELPDWVHAIDSSKSAKVCSFEYEGRKYLFKAFLKRNFWEPIKNILAGSRSLRAKRGTKLLLDSGIKAPIVICIGGGRGVRLGDSFIVTEFIETDFNLAVFLRDVADINKRCELVRSLGKVVGLMHSKNLYHGDLRPGNILITVKDVGFEFYFIDNERNRETSSPSEDKLITNLVQINMLQLSIVSLTDRMRFFKEYSSKLGFDKEYGKYIVRLVWKRTEERMDNEKQGGLYS